MMEGNSGQLIHVFNQKKKTHPMKPKTTHLPFSQKPYSLTWEGNTLIDWVSGGNWYCLDGSFQSSNRLFSGRFNGVAALPDGSAVAIFEQRWTKGLLIMYDPADPKYRFIDAGNRIFPYLQFDSREINRSYYQADAYDFPVALFRLPDGQPAILHCPEEYNRLEIEVLENGKRLTGSEERNPEDCFHSRLQVSPSGRYALSAGWVWHPVDGLWVYDILRALEDPLRLDEGEPVEMDVASATFLSNDHVAFCVMPDVCHDAEELLGPSELRVYDPGSGKTLHRVGYEAPFASLLPTDDPWHVWDLGEYPKVVDLRSGEVVAAFPDVITKGRSSSIYVGYDPAKFPPYALHPNGRRLAVGTEEGITIVEI
jgi:hypothetical protein